MPLRSDIRVTRMSTVRDRYLKNASVSGSDNAVDPFPGIAQLLDDGVLGSYPTLTGNTLLVHVTPPPGPDEVTLHAALPTLRLPRCELCRIVEVAAHASNLHNL
jgi:hypothetical protein